MRYFFITLISLLFLSFNFKQENDAFTFKEDKKRITIELETKQNYFELNKLTKFKVYFENIDINKTAISGRGISLNHNERGDGFISCIVTVTKESLKDNSFVINIRYNSNSKNNFHTFTLPVK